MKFILSGSCSTAFHPLCPYVQGQPISILPPFRWSQFPSIEMCSQEMIKLILKGLIEINLSATRAENLSVIFPIYLMPVKGMATKKVFSRYLLNKLMIMVA